MKNFSMQSVTGFHIYSGYSIKTDDLKSYCPQWSIEYPAPYSNDSQRELTAKVRDRFEKENPNLTVLKVLFSCGEWWIEADKISLSLEDRIEEIKTSFKEKQNKITNNVVLLSNDFEGTKSFNEYYDKNSELYISKTSKTEVNGRDCDDYSYTNQYYNVWDLFQKQGDIWQSVGTIRKFSHIS